MRKVFTMTDEEYQELLEACKPVAYIVVGGHEPRSPQENANNAWKRLGTKMGFDWNTVVPDGTRTHNFTAVKLEEEKQ